MSDVAGQGGDPPCWAHLFADDGVEGAEGAEGTCGGPPTDPAQPEPDPPSPPRPQARPQGAVG